MGRTQIYLTEHELQLLDQEARTTGATRSALIRRAVNIAYAERSRPRLTFVGAAPGLAIDPDEIDDLLADAYRESEADRH